MRNDKTASNFQQFQANFTKIDKSDKDHCKSLFLQFQPRGVKYTGTGNDTSQFKGALTHTDGC